MKASKNSNKAGSDDIKKWFDNGTWRTGLSILPDPSVNKDLLYAEFHKNEVLWNKAFDYLKTLNPDSLAIGRYNLSGDDLYAMVSEYVSKNEEDAKFEAHRKYADIQYVISGEEKIGLEPLNESGISVPYNEAKDVAFYNIASKNFRMANQKVFFVFFPQDAHCPGVKISENRKVKKLVIKVKLE
jgi:YhcH/YjgK/YiaL family protein